MGDKKSKKSAVSKASNSKPSSKSQGKPGKSIDVAKEIKTKELNVPGLAKMKGNSGSLETILIAPVDYVSVFHRERKAPDNKLASPEVTSTICSKNKKNMVSKTTSIKTKKSSTQPKSQKGKTVSQKAKPSSRPVKSVPREKNTKNSNVTGLKQQPKMANYVVKALTGRMDNFLKQYDHNCSSKCNCPKNKERKSQKKS